MVDIICGRCRHRWFYEGNDFGAALARHHEAAHPLEVAQRAIDAERFAQPSAPSAPPEADR